MANTFCQRVGIDLPIGLAPMGGAVGPELTAAVGNAGGLGCIPLWYDDLATVRRQIAATRALTDRPFAVNLNLNWPQEERLEACLDEGVGIISLFWGLSAPLIERAHRGGATVMQTVGSAEEARRAVEAGADVIVAQGFEAGGHVWGQVATLPLVPAVVDAVAPVPVIAAGGIADGRGLAAVLSLGASAAWIGTRFLMAREATIHPRYRERLAEAAETDTYYGTLYDIGWPDGPNRTLRNETVAAWERAGRPPTGKRPGEGEEIAETPQGGLVRYGVVTPQPDAVGDIDNLMLCAGQGVGLVHRLQPAAEIVRDIVDAARAALDRAGKAAVA
jgi:NAD(P)H-dependent flavin oxidoreductase YrpB (nitropropane dioxygenase family)